ncbi:MAG TPA: dihydroorotase [Edaphobacter sp.]|nr:dihydroorotase [Edaphobacter sp.]
MSDVLILNGRLIDPASGVHAERDVLLRRGRVAAIETPGGFQGVKVKETGSQVIDATGMIVAPGLVDVHVHLREPGQTYKESIATGTAAAAAGGFTSVVAMPNTVPVNDSVAGLEWMLDAARAACVKLFAMPAATSGSLGETITDFHGLKRAGAVGFTDDGKPVLHDRVMREALVAAARVGVPLSQHAEDTRLTGGCSMNAGPVAFRLGLRGMTVEAEARIVERDIHLLKDIERRDGLRPHLHVQHVSTEKAISLIRDAKAAGLHVTCEAAPHHFTLTDEAIGDYDTNAKMNPPLRAETDRLAIIAGLMDGTVDCIATDHAPHVLFEKEQEFERAPNGIIGLETALGLALRVLHKGHGMTVSRLIQLMSMQPAGIVSLEGRGSLAAGSFADVVVFDPTAAWSFEAKRSRSKSRNTPFDGAPMLGKVAYTLSEGRVVFKG